MTRFVALAGLLACTTHDARSVQGVADASVDATEDACTFCLFDGSASYEASFPDAIPPPAEDCSDAGTCALPPSVCAASNVLEYFDDPLCVDGGCVFVIQFKYCDLCVDGGCYSNQTAPVPP